MVATLNVIAVFLLQEAPTFDLRSMWASMTLLVKSRRPHLVHSFCLFLRR